MEFNFQKELLGALKTVFGNSATKKQVSSLGLNLSRSGKSRYSINEIADYIHSLKRINNRTILTIFRDYDVTKLPGNYRQAIISGSPIYYHDKPCANGHLSIRTTNTRRCLLCAEAELDAIRTTKAIRTLESKSRDVGDGDFIDRFSSMKDAEKLELLHGYLGDAARAAEFHARAKLAGLV